MILIWGLRVRAKQLATGTFCCPSCGVDRRYSHKQARRWFTAFFIPLIPLKVVGEYVQCTTCNSTYKPSVLTLPTTESLRTNLMLAMREAIVTVLGQTPTPSEMHEALLVLSSFADAEWHEDDLIDDIAHLDTSQLQGHLATLSDGLNEHGKERIVAGCARVAATGGTIDAGHREIVLRIASDIGMTRAHARGVIDEVIEQQHA
ncbi:MAG TPA: zinc ribbon domain-containing protein [Acidimicrobiales bacterium]|nr:zinc ribbon domain-containing protein [Acidimicrobiales bacterium]